jgi:prophage antirepressor-like protein
MLAAVAQEDKSVSNELIVSQSDADFQTFTFNDIDIRAMSGDQGEPLLVADDICKAIELANTSQAVSRLDDDEKLTITKVYNGVPVRYLMVTEPGLYSLTLRSNKPEAKVFKRFVTHEVLPALRKTGTYSVKPMTQAQINLANAQAAVILEERLTRLEAHIDEKLGDMNLSVEKLADTIENEKYLTVLQFCARQSIKVPPSVRSQWGRDASAMSRSEHKLIYKEMELGLPVGRYHEDILVRVCVAKPPALDNQPELLS